MRRLLFSSVLVLLVAQAVAGEAADYERERAELLEEVRRDVNLTRQELGKDALDPRVLDVLGRVPRHEFVPEALRRHAYLNRPLPIGYGQTISQPYIVAIMTDLLETESGDKVLEVGTGSAYQAAILAGLVDKVFSIEIIPELGESARRRLSRLGYDNVSTRVGDGYYGWENHAPFDAIIVTAAAGHVPPPLLDQLEPGGRMLIPVGSAFAVQHLMLVTKSDDGEIRSRQVLPVAFVPLTGQH
ncbi:MAG: protein-L-isoaspartate(D-aspartate) O-methyltransferase [Acidobacteriota bacterium]|nr:protein-L-isoaspartate(D-aspartate) O-methyltransferase [Acidobacteriota bacterium]